MNRIEVSYSRGKAKMTLPLTMKMPGRQRKRIPVVLEMTIEEAVALREALSFTGMWLGDGYTHYDWPAAPEKKKRGKAKT